MSVYPHFDIRCQQILNLLSMHHFEQCNLTSLVVFVKLLMLEQCSDGLHRENAESSVILRHRGLLFCASTFFHCTSLLLIFLARSTACFSRPRAE